MSDPSEPKREPPWRSAHDDAESLGNEGYFDPQTGLFVMTTRYLIERGTCCESRCRHCPYGLSPLAERPEAGTD